MFNLLSALVTIYLNKQYCILWIRCIPVKVKPPTKLIRKGRMEVLDMNQDAYTVLDIVSRRNQVMHISRLYLFFYDDIRVDPENIILRDSE